MGAHVASCVLTCVIAASFMGFLASSLGLPIYEAMNSGELVAGLSFENKHRNKTELTASYETYRNENYFFVSFFCRSYFGFYEVSKGFVPDARLLRLGRPLLPHHAAAQHKRSGIPALSPAH